MNKLKSLLPYGVCLLIFVAISVLYFSPDIFEGKVLFQADTQQGLGIGQETQLYKEQTGETSRWTNSLFGGMPTYQSSPSYAARNVALIVEKVYRLFLPIPVSYLYTMMVGFFILMLSMGVKKKLAVLGAIMYAFSSYFLIIIEAGHIWKLNTLSYIPPTIAGILLVYRGKYALGAALTAFFAALQIYSNHVQMTYYSLFLILALVIAIFIDKLRMHQLKDFFKASAILAACAILAAGVNVSNLYHTYQYSQETMRGGSELAAFKTSSQNAQASSGLEKEYITQWSYGIDETLSLLIPNINGGATGMIGADKRVMDKVKPAYRQYIQQMNHYWGNQPFTSGPVYVGAFVLFLFILGLFVVKGPLKWALFAATAFSIVMSWGKNFMLPTDLFIDFFPLYNKFRAVSSILVIAEICIPILAVLALKEAITTPDFLKTKRDGLITALFLTAGVSLIIAITPHSFFSFLSEQERQAYLPQAAQQPELMNIINELVSTRAAILSADAWRSFFIVLVGAGALLLYLRHWIKATWLVVIISVLTLGDLWQVDKRYLNSSKFVAKRKVSTPFAPTAADKEILSDTDPNFRVLNLTTNTFNDAVTSYFHKSVGGYHAAKLQRYQDIIDMYMSGDINQNVINMLNTKYIIVKGENGQPVAMRNPEAFGNAWLVSFIDIVPNAAQEIINLDKVDLLSTAVVDKRFEKDINPKVLENAAGNAHNDNGYVLKEDSININTNAPGYIQLTSYMPNELRYVSDSEEDALGVFSEIYYPGWKATIDGKEVDIIRADYILRAINIPKGRHEIVMEFRPVSIRTTDAISWISMVIIAAMGIWGLSLWYKKI